MACVLWCLCPALWQPRGWLWPLEPFSGAANEFGRCEQRPSSLLRVNEAMVCLIQVFIIVLMLLSLVIDQAVA